MSSDPPIVSAAGVVRRFGSTTALDGAELTIRRGEIHAVLGENGAGKTTLMRMLAGLDRPDAGTVSIHGEPVEQFDPRLARRSGVALVQQHFTLVPTLTAGENLELARPEGARRLPRKRSRGRLEALVERFGLPVRSDVPASRLSVGEQQRLELLRALDADAEILVLDEPTAVLTDVEAEQLFGVCRRLVDEGRAVSVITHRLGEVLANCDRVTVLRSGRNVLTDVPIGEIDRASLTDAMVGRSVEAPSGSTTTTTSSSEASSVRLRVDGVRLGRLLEATFEVRAGEILGVAGVDGNGQAELEAVLAGLVAPEGGTVEIDGAPLPAATPAARREFRVAYIPSDRYRHGLVGPLDLADNLDLGRAPGIRPGRRHRRSAATGRLDQWDVRGGGPTVSAGDLSGGNAQKLVLSRELGEEPSAVIACHPTRGLDPGAAATVAERLVAFAAGGAAVLWIGAELDELFNVCDRLVVLAGGEIADRCDPPFERARIGAAMASALPVSVGDGGTADPEAAS